MLSKELCGKHWHQRECHGEGTKQGKADDNGHLCEEDGGETGHEDNRKKDSHGGQGSGHNGTGDLPASLHGGIEGPHSQLAFSVDVLQYYDRVVDQHSDSQSEAAKGDNIEREAIEIHEAKGGQYADGNGR